jgi:hypothetical protein
MGIALLSFALWMGDQLDPRAGLSPMERREINPEIECTARCYTD